MSENSNAVATARLRPGQFYGETIGKRSCSGLVLSELKHKAGQRLQEHSHQLAYFCLLIDGDYAESCGRKTFEYRPLTITFHPPELAHRDEIGNHDGHFFIVELESQWMERLGEYSAVPKTITGIEGGDLAWLALRLYREFKSPHACSLLAVEGLAMTMLAELPRACSTAEKRPPRWLARADDLLHAEFHKDLNVNRVAAEVGVHPFHLSKVFRQFHQQTVSEYLKSLRVKFACRELFNPETELATVALAAGFADQSHFTRVFKQFTGMTPGAFRLAIREGTASIRQYGK